MMSTRRLVPATIASLLALAVLTRVPAVAISPPAVGPDAAPATFVGAATCASCHRDKHDAWKSGRHSKMLQPATSASVVGDFSTSSITLRGSRYRLEAENGAFFITESSLTGKERRHQVEYTLGSRRIQHYLTTDANGWIIVLPPSWDVLRREWFHNMEIVRPDEDDRTLVQQWNKNCVGCHVSQQDVNYNPATRTYATRWVDFGTSCERCHGPGSAHVAQYRLAESAGAADPLIVKPTRLAPARSSMICAQCHSLRAVVSPAFVAGEDYSDHFQPELEYGSRADREATYWADGRPRRFSNDAIGLWQSECFIRGGATCTSCHKDPHEPDIERNPQLAPGNNALCTQCHADIGAKLTAHTRHQASSAGSSCVECHMPKTVMSIKAVMRDHSISLPAPETTVAYAIPNACNQCHADRTPGWAVETLARWWPEARRAKFLRRADAFTAARAGRADALEPLVAIAKDERQGPFIQANALGYLRHYADPRARATLLDATRSPQAVIRSVAMFSLGQLDVRERPVRAALVSGLDDPRRAVRIAALVSLANPAIGGLDADEEGRFRRVSREFEAAARLREDDAGTQRDLGYLQLLIGDVDRAGTSLLNAMSLEPDRPSVKYLLGLARLAQNRMEDARLMLRQVPPSDPFYDAAQQRLKQLAAPK